MQRERRATYTHPMTAEREKDGAARLSLAYNLLATAGKIVAAALTGSVGLAGEAAHSAVDVVSSGIALLSVRYAARPPDEDHPYGHGKVEAVSALAEAGLLFLTAGPLVVASVGRLISGGAVERVELGAGVMAVSAVSAFVVAARVSAVARRTGSPALEGNGHHLRADGLTSLGVLAGLLATRLTGWNGADGLVGTVLGVSMVVAGGRLGVGAVQQLLDRALPADEQAKIRAILDADPGVISHHALRGRHLGSDHDVDVHVVVARDWSVVQAHDLADRLETEIEAALAPCRAVIHIDPLDEG